MKFLRRLLVVAAVIAICLVAFNIYWRVNNPAPLGRTTEAVTQRLSQALPRGTPIDSVDKYLAAYGLEVNG